MPAQAHLFPNGQGHLHVRGGSTGSKVTISQSRAPILLYGGTGFAAVSQLFCNESVLYMFFAVLYTSSSVVPFMNDFLGYHLADLYDLGR